MFILDIHLYKSILHFYILFIHIEYLCESTIFSTTCITPLVAGISIFITPEPSNFIRSEKNVVLIYTLTGQQVFKTTLQNNTGFYNKKIDVSSLSEGIYILKFIFKIFSSSFILIFLLSITFALRHSYSISCYALLTVLFLFR